MGILLIRPNTEGDAYARAAEVFCDLALQVTGQPVQTSDKDDKTSDLVVIGSDAVNDFLMREVLDLSLSGCGLRYGTEDYRMFTYRKDGRNVLVLAGGRGRSTLYAVYDYFERFCGCRYFWDGDVIPHRDALPMDGIDVTESPRFDYRGLRYFAHRGLHRFQAEHWSLDDWKRELDWLVKRRLNFFMLRIGMDDVWQQAFPDTVPYPETYRNVEIDADAEGYLDRSDFWTMRYRGELRKAVLAYARRLDLTYSTDCGTMTHWYSLTPEAFLEKKQPSLLAQANKKYNDIPTGKVFDFTQKKNMDYYMRLTETMAEKYEDNNYLFHTIGLGERRIYRDPQKNFALKLVAYRRIAESLRQRYPNSKLLIASWDFGGFWTTEEVRNVMTEFDPQRTVLLDYTSESVDPNHNFTNWNVVGKFPWIFGLFHAYESESELRGPYDRSQARLKIAAEDPACKGMVLWPELSHSDPLVLEFLAQNAWSPCTMTVEQILDRFCAGRYGDAGWMTECWHAFLPLIKLGDWGGELHCHAQTEDDPILCASWYTHQDVWTKLTHFLGKKDAAEEPLRRYFRFKLSRTLPLLPSLIEAVERMSEEDLSDPFVLRDAIDLARTALSRFLNFLVMETVQSLSDPLRVAEIGKRYFETLSALEDLIRLTSDFSVYETLKQLQRTAPTNPDFEITLKRNISCSYCSQPAVELVEGLFRPEAEEVFAVLSAEPHETIPDFKACGAAIRDRFYRTPLADLQPEDTVTARDAFAHAAAALGNLQTFFS